MLRSTPSASFNGDYVVALPLGFGGHGKAPAIPNRRSTAYDCWLSNWLVSALTAP